MNRIAMKELSAAKVELISLYVRRLELADRVSLARKEIDLKSVNNTMSNFILHFKDIGETTIVAFYPEVAAAPPVDELGGDAYPVRRLAHAPLEDGPHPQIATHMLDVRRLSFVSENRSTGYD